MQHDLTEAQRQKAIELCDQILERHDRAKREITEGLAGLRATIDEIISKCRGEK